MENLNIPRSSLLLLSVSGGVDSVAMLHIFQRIRKIEDWKELQFKIIHFNHKVRVESEEEANFVQSLGNAYGIDVFHRILSSDAAYSPNFQNNARIWRKKETLDLLQTFEHPLNATYYTTAHHKDDQIETIMMKLLRGAYITNFSKIKTLEGKCIRPLLCLKKDDLRDYMMEQKLEWREDSSNQCKYYKRNKIRLDLVPLLADLTGGQSALERRLFALSDQSDDVKELVDVQVAASASKYKAFKFENQYMLHFQPEIPTIVLREILFRWIHNSTGLRPDYSQLSEVLDLSTKTIQHSNSVSMTLDPCWELTKVGCELRLKNKKSDPPRLIRSKFQYQSKTHDISHPSTVEIVPFDASNVSYGGVFTICVPFEPNIFHDNMSLVLRYPIPKDRIEQDLNGTVRSLSLSKYLRNMKVPMHQRDRTLVLTIESSENNKVLGAILPTISEIFLPKGLNSASSLYFNVKYSFL